MSKLCSFVRSFVRSFVCFGIYESFSGFAVFSFQGAGRAVVGSNGTLFHIYGLIYVKKARRLPRLCF